MRGAMLRVMLLFSFVVRCPPYNITLPFINTRRQTSLKKMAPSIKNASSRNREKKLSVYQRFQRFVKIYGNKETIQLIALNPDYTWLVAAILLIAELVLNVMIIRTVPYTEIDWKAYMQEVEGVVNGTFNYAELRGDTGPLVYPAGFVYIYAIFYFLTNRGANIYFAQHIFLVIYLLTLIAVFRIYCKTRKVPPYSLLFLCCTSYRIHSIYVLRLFNDPVAMLFLYLAINLFLDKKWTLGSFVYSLAVSIKMNILLFAPALFFIMLAARGCLGTLKLLIVCALTQVVLSLPFILDNPRSYLLQAFDFSRIFLYQWTVNWKFIDESIFVSRPFHIFLLSLHLGTLFIFILRQWIKLAPTLKDFIKGQFLLSANCLVLPLFTANLIGIVFSRSLHYQFYVWYFHSLPYLLWNTRLPSLIRILILGVIELCWNTFPATSWSSATLLVCHLLLLGGLSWNQAVPVSVRLNTRNATVKKND